MSRVNRVEVLDPRKAKWKKLIPTRSRIEQPVPAGGLLLLRCQLLP